MDLDEHVRFFVSGLSQVSDTRTLAILFEEIVSRFGCRYFVISAIPDEANLLQEMLVVHNLPREWVEEYLSKNYIDNDPIARHCVLAQDPFFWREAKTEAGSAEATQIMLRAELFGLRNGICFPIHNINGLEAGVSLSGFQNLPKRTEVRSLYLASIMTFNALRRIRSDHSLRIEPISSREKEVLTWCALGRTSKEIAYILFVSENTVNAHIKNAIQKLSARNKTEAVTIAVRMGLISI